MRISLVGVVTGFIILLMLDHGQDALLRFVEDVKFLDYLGLILSAFGWGVATHYCARLMVAIDFGVIDRDEQWRYAQLARWLPRALGAMTFVTIAAALSPAVHWAWRLLRHCLRTIKRFLIRPNVVLARKRKMAAPRTEAAVFVHTRGRSSAENSLHRYLSGLHLQMFWERCFPQRHGLRTVLDCSKNRQSAHGVSTLCRMEIRTVALIRFPTELRRRQRVYGLGLSANLRRI